MTPDNEGESAQVPAVAEHPPSEPDPTLTSDSSPGVAEQDAHPGGGDQHSALGGDEGAVAAPGEEIDLDAVEELESSDVVEVDDADVELAEEAGASGAGLLPRADEGAAQRGLEGTPAGRARPGRRAPLDVRSSSEILEALQKEGGAERVAALRRELAAEQVPWRRAVLEHEIGVRLEAEGDGEAAAEAWGRALVEDPSLKPNLWALRQLCERRGDWPNLGALIIAEARAASSPRERAELYVERGHLLEDHLGDQEGAQAAYRTALAEDEASLPALMALERRALRSPEDAAAQRELVARLADATGEPGRRGELLVELARFEAGEPTGRPFERLREALLAGGSPARVLDEAERLANERSDGAELLRMVEQRVAVAEAGSGPRADERVVDLRRYQASLLVATESEKARACLEAALARAPADPLVLSDLADLAGEEERWADAADLLGRLERVVAPAVARRVALARGRALRMAGREEEATLAESVVDDSLELRVLRCMERQEHATAAGEPDLLLPALDEEAELAREAGDAAWSARTLAAAAALRERLGDAEGGLAGWRAAVEANPDDEVALAALDAALDRAGLDAERVKILERRLGVAGSGEAAGLLEELVELRFDRLGDAEGARLAAEALCRLRALDGGLAEAAVRARLVEIERRTGRWPELESQLGRLAAALREGGAIHDAVDAELSRAELLERLGDSARALAAIDEALRAVPDHERAHAERRRLLSQGGDWQGVAESLRREADLATEPRRLARVLVELAQVLEGRLRRSAEAAQVWRELRERAPGALSPARSWHARPALDVDPLSQARAGEAELTAATEEELGEGWLRVGELLEEAHADDAEVARALSRAVAASGDARPHAALGLYRVAARGRDEHALDGAMAALLPLADAPGAAVLSEARAALAARNGDLVGARQRLDEAVRADPGRLSPRLRRARLAARAARPRELAEALADLAAHTSDSMMATVLRLRAATLLAAAADGEGARAELTAELSVAHDPGASAGPPWLGAAASAVQTLLPGSHAGETPIEVAESLLAAGRLAEAAAAAADLASRRPGDAVSLDLLRRIARAGGDRLGEARALHALSAVVTASSRAASLLEEAAAMLDGLGERVEAAQAYRALVRLRPDAAAFRARAEALLEELNDTTSLEGLLDERIERAASDQEAHALRLERGLLRARAGRPGAAAEDLETVLGAIPDDPRALEALATLRAETGDRTGAAYLLERRLAAAEAGSPGVEGGGAAGVPAESHALLLRLLELYQGLGSVDGIRRTLRRLDPGSREDIPIRARAAEVLERFRDAAGAIEQLTLLAALEPDDAARGRLELRIAVLHRDGAGDLHAARAALGRALAINPIDLDALAALMPLCVSGDDRILRDAALLRATRAAQGLIEADPEQPGGYEVLERILDWQGDDDGRQLALQSAAAIAGRPIPPRRGGLEPSLELPAALFDAVFPPEAWGPARSLWRDTHEAAQRLLGADLGALGVGRTTRVNEKSTPPPWQTVDRIARALGVTSYALHAVAGPGDVCATAGEALVVGAAFGGSPGPDERFQVARKLVLLRDRLGPLEGATDESIELFFAACAQVAGTSWSEGRHLSATRVEEWAKVVDRTLDRRARKALQDQAAQFDDLTEVGTWRRAVLAGANRIALAVAGDLSACLSELRLDPASAAGRALVRFAVSDEMRTLRRAMGQRS